MATTMDVAKKLVELCRQDKNVEAVNSLYAPNVVSIEAREHPPIPGRAEGIVAVREKNEWWRKNHEVHKAEAMGPFPHGDRFVVHYKYEVTPKAGPMSGKRMTMEEGALYTVKNGKIVQEEFFYDM